MTSIATEPKASTGTTLIALLYAARGLRGFGDGFAIIILPAYMAALGYDAIAIGLVATASLLGTALLTLIVGWMAPRHDLRALMLLGAGLMAATGLAFPNVEQFLLIALVAFVGTITPSAGDLGVLVPLEHAALARLASDHKRTHTFPPSTLIGPLSSPPRPLAPSLRRLSFAGGASRAKRAGLGMPLVFLHFPSLVSRILAAFAPNLYVALGLLLLRAALWQMDVPTRSSSVMAVVTPAERPAAASVTAVPRSLASAISPAISGALLMTAFSGLPLVVCGTLKIAYDLALLVSFRHVKPPGEKA